MESKLNSNALFCDYSLTLDNPLDACDMCQNEECKKYKDFKPFFQSVKNSIESNRENYFK